MSVLAQNFRELRGRLKRLLLFFSLLAGMTAVGPSAIVLVLRDSASSASYEIAHVSPWSEARTDPQFVWANTGRRVGFGKYPLSPPTATPTVPPTPTPTSEPTPTHTPRPPFVWPTDGWISQRMKSEHLGIDIAVQAGDSVRAIRDGSVVYAGGDPCCGYGYLVVVQHDEGWKSVYAHLSRIGVTAGNSISQGGLLGLAGETGNAKGPHLHFELRSGGQPVDPLRLLPAGRG